MRNISEDKLRKLPIKVQDNLKDKISDVDRALVYDAIKEAIEEIKKPCERCNDKASACDCWD